MNNKQKKNKVHVGAIIAISVSVSLLMLIMVCAISLIPGPIYDALLAYDTGTSTDLSLPITIWGLCAFIDVLLITLLSVLVNKKLNKKLSKDNTN